MLWKVHLFSVSGLLSSIVCLQMINTECVYDDSMYLSSVPHLDIMSQMLVIFKIELLVIIVLVSLEGENSILWYIFEEDIYSIWSYSLTNTGGVETFKVRKCPSKLMQNIFPFHECFLSYQRPVLLTFGGMEEKVILKILH